jgi:hypothetical protein
VNVEAHVAGVKKDAGIRMASGIVKKVDGRFGGGECTFGLGGSKTAKGNEHGIINGSAIIKKNPDNLLESGDFFWLRGSD